MEISTHSLKQYQGQGMDNKEIALSKTLKKVRYKILPVIVLMFIMSMIDRSNIGFIKEYIEVDVGITESIYAFGVAIFFIGYATFQIPSNLFLHKIGAKRWLSITMIAWGILTVCMNLTTGEYSFYILRFLLGIAEAGFSPGIILYLSYWFPYTHRSKAYGIYECGVPLAFILSGPLSGWVLQYAPPYYLSNWQWMFLAHGMISIIVGILAFIILKDKPENAHWLKNEEKQILIKSLEEEKEQEVTFSSKDIYSTFKNSLIWKLVFIYFSIQLNVYAITFYLPSKLSEFLGKSVGIEVGLFFSLPWIFTLIFLPILTGYADKKRLWSLSCTILMLIGGISIGIAAFIPFFSIFILTITLASISFIVIQPIFWNIPTRFLSGKSAAVGIAMIGAIGNLGGFVAPILKTQVEILTQTSYMGFMSLAIIGILGMFMLAHIRYGLKIN